MTDAHWNDLLSVINGELLPTPPVGFIIDCPWLPGWYGRDIMDYFSDDRLWFESNKKAIEAFPDIMFLPGFWAEYGMCSEPSAFGARCAFFKNEFPHVHKTIHSVDDIDRLTKPDAASDGFPPFLLNRLRLNQPKIEDMGHKIRFSVSRGPLNIASYLMGTTEFLLAMMMQPDKVHKLLGMITDYLADWHQLQRETFPTIDGIMMLDDIIGFIGESEFVDFVYPYLKRLYNFDVNVKFLHNDAECGVSLKYLPELGINLFNMGYDTDLNHLKKETKNKVTMLGNIPPRDVLADGTPEEVMQSVAALAHGLEDKSRVIFSCGGGMPPNVSTENIKAFCQPLKS